jgi:hypothetical protein
MLSVFFSMHRAVVYGKAAACQRICTASLVLDLLVCMAIMLQLQQSLLLQLQ